MSAINPVESSPAEKGLGMLLDERLDMPWPYALAPRNPHILGSSPVAWTAGKEGILSPCPAQMRSPPGGLNLGSSAQEGLRPAGVGREESMKMIRGLEHLCHGNGLSGLGLFSLEKERVWSDLIAAFHYLK